MSNIAPDQDSGNPYLDEWHDDWDLVPALEDRSDWPDWPDESEPEPEAIPDPLQQMMDEAAEARATREARVWIPTPFACCGLPIVRPAGRIWHRRNGGDVLIVARANGSLPFGRLPYMLMIGLSRAIHDGASAQCDGGRRVVLGRSWSEAMRLCRVLQPGANPGGGKGGRLTQFQEQIEALFGSDLFWLRSLATDSDERQREFEFEVAELEDWCSDRKGPPPLPVRSLHFKWRLDLEDGIAVWLEQETFDLLFTHSTVWAVQTLDSRVIDRLLPHQTLALQVYAWLVHRSQRGIDTIHTGALCGQFGTNTESVANFARKLKPALTAVRDAWAGCPVLDWQKGVPKRCHARIRLGER